MIFSLFFLIIFFLLNFLFDEILKYKKQQKKILNNFQETYNNAKQMPSKIQKKNIIKKSLLCTLSLQKKKQLVIVYSSYSLFKKKIKLFIARKYYHCLYKS